jgi:hypothetical protein
VGPFYIAIKLCYFYKRPETFGVLYDHALLQVVGLRKPFVCFSPASWALQVFPVTDSFK